jgi:predicted PurR-regulated permease PerM
MVVQFLHISVLGLKSYNLMENQVIKPEPFYRKATIVLFGIVLLFYILSLLADLLIPLAFAVLFAILLSPLNNRFRSWGFPKIIAIILTLLVAIIGIAAVFYFLSTQLLQFGEMLPTLKLKFKETLHQMEYWVESSFGIAVHKQVKYLNEIVSGNKALIGSTLIGALGVFSIIFLIPVYIFLLIYYKELILNFLYEIFSRKSSKDVGEVLRQTKIAIQSYIVGLLIETFIIAIMNSAALIFLGVPYAILIGVIGAILNLIPYIGGIVAILLPIIIATVTIDGYTTQIAILIAYSIIQFIDNNIIVPRVVSSQVQINALISIIAVLLGGALWGVSGMFLSIPFVAVLKIVFDRVEGLKPWGKLLGDEIPVSSIHLKMRPKWRLRLARQKVKS